MSLPVRAAHKMMNFRADVSPRPDHGPFVQSALIAIECAQPPNQTHHGSPLDR